MERQKHTRNAYCTILLYLTLSKMLKVCAVIAVVALCLTALTECSKKSIGCYNEDELVDVAQHFMKKYLRLSDDTRHPHLPTAPSCSDFIHRTLSTSSKAYHNRSISPWWYRIDHDEDRYPSRISFAECLCDGCIINGKENRSYNSVPVHRTELVLRRTKCPINPHAYSFEVSAIKVPVACTCVRPISSQ